MMQQTQTAPLNVTSVCFSTTMYCLHEISLSQNRRFDMPILPPTSLCTTHLIACSGTAPCNMGYELLVYSICELHTYVPITQQVPFVQEIGIALGACWSLVLRIQLYLLVLNSCLAPNLDQTNYSLAFLMNSSSLIKCKILVLFTYNQETHLPTFFV